MVHLTVLLTHWRGRTRVSVGVIQTCFSFRREALLFVCVCLDAISICVFVSLSLLSLAKQIQYKSDCGSVFPSFASFYHIELMWMEPISSSSLSLRVNVSVRVYMCTVHVRACAYACTQVCVTKFFFPFHFILYFLEEITHGWFYSILRRTTGEGSRQQGSSYYHLVSTWEKLHRELLWGYFLIKPS